MTKAYGNDLNTVNERNTILKDVKKVTDVMGVSYHDYNSML
jgi:hypothetical protein